MSRPRACRLSARAFSVSAFLIPKALKFARHLEETVVQREIKAKIKRGLLKR